MEFDKASLDDSNSDKSREVDQKVSTMNRFLRKLICYKDTSQDSLPRETQQENEDYATGCMQGFSRSMKHFWNTCKKVKDWNDQVNNREIVLDEEKDEISNDEKINHKKIDMTLESLEKEKIVALYAIRIAGDESVSKDISVSLYEIRRLKNNDKFIITRLNVENKDYNYKKIESDSAGSNIDITGIAESSTYHIQQESEEKLQNVLKSTSTKANLRETYDHYEVNNLEETEILIKSLSGMKKEDPFPKTDENDKEGPAIIKMMQSEWGDWTTEHIKGADYQDILMGGFERLKSRLDNLLDIEISISEVEVIKVEEDITETTKTLQTQANTNIDNKNENISKFIMSLPKENQEFMMPLSEDDQKIIRLIYGQT